MNSYENWFEELSEEDKFYIETLWFLSDEEVEDYYSVLRDS